MDPRQRLHNGNSEPHTNVSEYRDFMGNLLLSNECVQNTL